MDGGREWQREKSVVALRKLSSIESIGEEEKDNDLQQALLRDENNKHKGH